jgi:predicted GNAT family acetyltransferase
MLRTRPHVRVLGPADLDDVLRLLSQDPVTHVFLEHRARLTRLDPRWLGGEVWGYDEGNGLEAICHSAANLAPGFASGRALEAFASRALAHGRKCGSIIGRHDEIESLWQFLEPEWGPARSIRPHQPFMVLDTPPAVAPSPDVRRVRPDELDVLYPACVAMYTEELEVSPEAGGGASMYRARVNQLIAKGHAFAIIEDGRVLFKAELGSITPHACQLQSVWVTPELRGRGIGTAGVAAICGVAMAEVAPVVSLYVNQHNEAAQRAYAKVGFTTTVEFQTILF